MMTIRDFRDGRYASGGYPKYWICADGETLSYDACRANALHIGRAVRGDTNRADVDPARFYSSDRQWRVIGYSVNWEDPELYCSHTGERIESAYAESEQA